MMGMLALSQLLLLKQQAEKKGSSIIVIDPAGELEGIKQDLSLTEQQREILVKAINLFEKKRKDV
ncbi:hypothetical protein C6Y02_17105 [Bacillus sp. NMCC4]|uniref:hypothetical protein n=1 Tax=Bacillus sp. NMCC4 TaxID=2108539 RepID=UPI000D03B8B7|nr:hypothetical protein [Bacillus sp. NMCC4]PRS35730.1 hypothetical protein C6Y02_17105 [Bacillus sp. NMCC4]